MNVQITREQFDRLSKKTVSEMLAIGCRITVR